MNSGDALRGSLRERAVRDRLEALSAISASSALGLLLSDLRTEFVFLRWNPGRFGGSFGRNRAESTSASGKGNQRMKQHRRVAIYVRLDTEWDRRIVLGIARYANAHGRWTLQMARQGFAPPSQSGGDADGIIALGSLGRSAEAAGVPVVRLSGGVPEPSCPSVFPDNRAIGRLAAEHFLERGFRHFAYYGDETYFSQQRRDGFARAVARSGQPQGSGGQVAYLPVKVQPADTNEWLAQQSDVATWLTERPRPLGLLCFTDPCARLAIAACQVAGLDVPEEVAVLGVDNDELVCLTCSPLLSSIDMGSERIGHAAAALLHRLMAGKAPPSRAVLVPPVGVVRRQSTDVLAIEDADVASAVRYIREHYSERINVSDVLQAVPISRRVLEVRFRKLLGRPPAAEIRRMRVARAKQLLAETDLEVGTVADRCGFRTIDRLGLVFRKLTGQTPSGYRRKVRGPTT